MSQILDHVKAEPLLESADDWPRSIKRPERFAITHFMVQKTIADIDLDDAALSKVMSHLLERVAVMKMG